MNKTICHCLLGGIFLSILLLAPLPAAAIEDSIVAVVNNNVITYKDLHDYVSAHILQLRLEGRSPEEIKGNIEELERSGLRQLIEDRIIINEADLKGMEIRKDLVDERFEEIKGRYPTEEDFLQGLAVDGATITDLRKKIEDQFKIKYLIQAEVKSKIFVNPQEVTDYYNAHSDDYLKPERVNTKSIFIPLGADPNDARRKANEALAQLAAGKPFDEVAAAFSQGPSVGVLAKGQLIPEIENAVFKLNVDELSPVIPVDNGYYIFLVTGKIPQETSALEEVKDRIYDKLFEKKFKERFLSWLEGLKKKAYIEIKGQ